MTDVARFVRKELCACCGGTPPVWTPERIVQVIQEWADEHDGRPPSREDWRLSSYAHPGIQTVDRVFGTLGNALKAAGFAPRPAGPEKVWTRERIIEAIQTWAVRHGGTAPTKKDWLKSAPDHPTCETVVGEFKDVGGWNGAISAAGFFPRGKWGHRYTNESRTKRIAA